MSRRPATVEQGTLYVVATPIGNLGDLSQRALEVLGGVDCVAAEDTRTARRLLSAYELKRPLVSCHAHNEDRRAGELVARLRAGESVAFVSEAGTPGVSDPGARLVAAAVVAEIPVVAVPGPSATMAVLAVAGFPADCFLFLGFPPRRGTARREWLERAVAEPSTVVFFEAPHRLLATLVELARLAPERAVVVARELTKRFEEVRRGTLSQLSRELADEPTRGEYSLVLGPIRERTRGWITEAVELARRLMGEGLPPSQAARRAARGARVGSREVYRRLLEEEEAGDAE